MSNLHKWKKAEKDKAIEFREAREINDGATMKRVQDEIGIKRS